MQNLLRIERLCKALLCIAIILLVGCNNNQNSQGYIEGEYAYVSSAVSGYLTNLLVKRGDEVTLNQPLFVLDPEPEYSQLEQAKHNYSQAQESLVNLEKGQRSTVLDALVAQLSQANANLKLADITLKRYRELRKTGAIDQASLDSAESSYKQLSGRVKEISANIAEAKLGARDNQISAQAASVKATAAQVKQAEWALLQKSISAKTIAQVFDTLYVVGEYVVAGKPVVVLLPPENIKVIFFVHERTLSKIKLNGEVMFSCDSCKKYYSAFVTYIAPAPEYTPPVIFSKDSRDKLVYRIEAHPKLNEAALFHPGQPVDVKVK